MKYSIEGAKHGAIIARKRDNEGFFLSEFESLDLHDKRLENRALKIFNALQSKLTTCIKRLFFDPKDMRQAYDFFSNPKVSRAALMEPHIQKTVDRINASDAEYILAIQDITVLNFTSHLAKTELGRIGKTKKTEQYGLFQHNTLCVTDSNECLGLIDLQHFHHDDFDLSIPSDRRPVEEKNTICWINALKNMRKRLKGTKKKIVTVADREGDFFEFLHELNKENESFVVRAQHDRWSGKKHGTGDKLSTLFENQPVKGQITVTVNDVKTHEIKDIQLNIKALEDIELPVPRWPGGASEGKNYQPIRLNVIKVYNDEYCWILLTNFAVNEIAACQRVINMYKERWHIEDYHKILKTGYQIDEIWLHASRDAIENALTMAALAACRLHWIIYVGRVESMASADRIFAEHEWKAVYVYCREKIPEKTPSLSEVIIQIARLGGYKKLKNAAPPGIKIMWMGFAIFSVAAQMYESMSMKT